ncbi:AraC family transcriptional regulator [Hugenholtzia roseola]|uniref:AraC family transcriptional regulator n=1 Tax=Hugenholtzia roseola TaxID=1002 RepID=UPI000411CED6|nr:helix-turn-helix domain-containing protein [Hugenholtzia roseola]
MKKLTFERYKYKKELLIDATDELGLKIDEPQLVLNFYTILFIKKGSGTYFLNQEKIEIEKNTVIFIKPNQQNDLSEVTLEACVAIFFESDFLNDFFKDKNFLNKLSFFTSISKKAYLKIEDQPFHIYYQMAKELKEEIEDLQADSKHILRAIVYYLLTRLNQTYKRSYQNTELGAENLTIVAFLNLLEKNIRTRKGVSDYAEALQISRVQLNLLCQKHFAKTAQQLIQEKLILEIKKELNYTTKNITEISYEFNFSAPPHFSRFVRQMTGLSPQALREQLSNW